MLKIFTLKLAWILTLGGLVVLNIGCGVTTGIIGANEENVSGGGAAVGGGRGGRVGGGSGGNVGRGGNTWIYKRNKVNQSKKGDIKNNIE